METKLARRIIGVVALLFVLVIGFSVYMNRAAAPAEPAQKGAGQESAQAETISLTIQGLYEDKQVSVASGETMLQVLRSLDTKDPQLALSTKEYAGLGTLVQGMGGKKNGAGNKYWQYEVNGTMPLVGADKYELKGGESVRWFFEESEF